MNVFTALLFAGVAQGFILSIVLTTTGKNNRIPNLILAIIVAIFTVSILVHSIAHSENLPDIPYHAQLVQVLYFLMGPLILVYVNSLTELDFQFSRKDYLHFIPFSLASILFIPVYISTISDSTDMQISVLDKTEPVITWTIIAYNIIYLFICIMKLKRHSKCIQQSFSYIEKINLNWLKVLLSGILFTWTTATLIVIFTDQQDAWDYVWLLVSIFIYIIGYMGLKQPVILTGSDPAESVKENPKKYERSTLTREAAEKYLKKLIYTMDTDKPYLESDITLNSLAKKLAISAHHLSQIINEKLDQNFFEMINSYRVKEAKSLITDPAYSQINIASIGLDAGFNSISAFNAAFKKHAKITPSQYRESVSRKNRDNR